MEYFLCPTEGGEFIRIDNQKFKTCFGVLRSLKKQNCDFIAVFRNGVIYDTFLKNIGKNPNRHRQYGGRKYGKIMYDKLQILPLPTETITKG